MFNTLIESAPHRQPNRNASIVSALFHTALIGAAVWATTSGAASDAIATAATQVTKIHWVKTMAQPASAPARPVSKPKPKAPPVVAPKKIARTVPAIDPNAQPTSEPDPGPSTNLPAGGTPGAFNAFEVDVESVVISSTVRPEYPEMLRSSGTEGQVIAQFVVNEKGRVDRKTFRVLSSTNSLFSDAVSRALPQMRFKPAKMGNKPVSQLVQQLFVFRLDK